MRTFRIPTVATSVLAALALAIPPASADPALGDAPSEAPADHAEAGEKRAEDVREAPAVHGPEPASPALVNGVTAASNLTASMSAITVDERYPTPSDGIFRVRGRGYGHGIGMSAYGAQNAALQGVGYKQILNFYYPGTSLVTRDQPRIRVGLTSDTSGVTRVRAASGLTLKSNGYTTTLPTGPTQWRVRATGSTRTSCRLEGYRNGSWVRYGADGKVGGASVHCPATFSTPNARLDVIKSGGVITAYRGTIEAAHAGSTKLTTVNTVPQEHYLYSVLPHEVFPSWHTSALDAFAVGIRTYARSRMTTGGTYDLCDTTACQVYGGIGTYDSSGRLVTREHQRTTDAARRTAGRVLLYGGTFATTMFSASSGGYTAATNSAHPYLRAQGDPYDAGTTYNTWTAQLPASALARRFGLSKVTALRITQRDGNGEWGGRVLKATIEGRNSSGAAKSVDVTGEQIRFAYPAPANSKGLRSHYFTMGSAKPAPVTRVAGSSRYETAAKVAQEYATGTETVYIASGENFPDALAGAARAGGERVPILLTRRGSLPSATRTALERLKPKNIVILGSSAAVSHSVGTALKSYAPTMRIQGVNRYATAAAMWASTPTGTPVVYIASGENFPDALAGAARAGHVHAPLMLSRQSSLPAATRQQLARLKPARIVVLGSASAVSAGVRAELRAYASTGDVSRVSGATRYETAASVAQEYPAGVASVTVTTGQNFADALSASALAARHGGPIVLARSDDLPGASAKQVDRLNPAWVDVIGGPTVVGDAVIRAIRRLLA